MGCDITMFLERKRSTEDEWTLDRRHTPYMEQAGTPYEYKTLRDICVARSYRLFGEMAGVRSWSSVIPKGIPDDASEGYKEECERQGKKVHSHSYLSISEYKSILKQLGYLHQFNVKKHKWRDMLLEWWTIPQSVDDIMPFTVVLAYVHDEMEKNRVDYIITGDPYYLDEQYRLVFFFDD